MQIPDGGPAFPSVVMDRESVAGPERGMSLRDYFAAKAMQGYRASSTYATQSDLTIAQWAYKQADAMLTARDED